MFRVCAFALLGAMFVVSGGLVGQDAKKGQESKKADPPVQYSIERIPRKRS